MLRQATTLVILYALSAVLWPLQAQASSNLTAGSFAQAVQTGQSEQDVGICRLVTGPRDGLAHNQFVLTLADSNVADGEELRITGKFKAEGSWRSSRRDIRLLPDEEETTQYLEDLLRANFNDPKLELQLHTLKADVDEVRLPGKVNQFTCKIRLTGRVVSKEIGSGPITIAFKGLGQFVPGITSLATAPNCPLSSLAPAGLDPVAGQCATPNCLITKFGYQWWTSYDYFGPPFPQKSYYWNANNQWSPKNAELGSDGIHLFVRPQDTGGGLKPSAAEIVAMFNVDGSPVTMGYGDYLVTAMVKSAPSWDKLDPNVAFGAFTYERLSTDGTGSGDQNNPYRELDLAEISHWGYAGPLLPPSPPAAPPASCVTPLGNQLIDPRLCTGNSQFTLQIWNEAPNNLHRYSINGGVNTVTLVMRWHGASQPITFEQYGGSYTLATLPATPDNQWTTTDADNPFIPSTNCERFHLNFWMGDYPDAGNGFNPPPATLPQEVVVTNFEFQAFP